MIVGIYIYIFTFFNTFGMIEVIVFKSPIQSDLSCVCGAYVIHFAFMMSIHRTLNNIKNKFSRYKKRNDFEVSKYIH